MKSVFMLFILVLWGYPVTSFANDNYNVPLTNLEGTDINLRQYVGKKPLYLKLWATWCQPCRKQMPHFQSTHKKYKGQINVVGINLDLNEDKKEVLATISEFGLTMPTLIDYRGKFAQHFDVLGTPYHILIDVNGKIVHTGFEDSSALEDKLVKLAAGEKLPSIQSRNPKDTSAVDNQKSHTAVLFFVSTSCDWYLKDSRPEIANNCIRGQKLINTLYERNQDVAWQQYASRLWTGEKELREYTDKFNVTAPIQVDEGNAQFVKFNIKKTPTLVILKNDKEALRLEDFSDEKGVSTQFQKALNDK